MPDHCTACSGHGMTGYDRRGRPVPCPDCGGTGRRDAQEVVQRAAHAMIRYLRWFCGDKRPPMPRTADAILTEYSGQDERLWRRLSHAALDRANRSGAQSRESGKWTLRYGRKART